MKGREEGAKDEAKEEAKEEARRRRRSEAKNEEKYITRRMRKPDTERSEPFRQVVAQFYRRFEQGIPASKILRINDHIA